MSVKGSSAPPNDIIAVPNNYDRLVEKFVSIARENAQLREENLKLKVAVENLDTANIEIGNELNRVRWELIGVRQRLEKLERLDVSVEVQ